MGLWALGLELWAVGSQLWARPSIRKPRAESGEPGFLYCGSRVSSIETEPPLSTVITFCTGLYPVMVMSMM
jgi:hypothetical protein